MTGWIHFLDWSQTHPRSAWSEHCPLVGCRSHTPGVSIRPRPSPSSHAQSGRPQLRTARSRRASAVDVRTMAGASALSSRYRSVQPLVLLGGARGVGAVVAVHAGGFRGCAVHSRADWCGGRSVEASHAGSDGGPHTLAGCLGSVECVSRDVVDGTRRRSVPGRLGTVLGAAGDGECPVAQSGDAVASVGSMN